MPRLLRKGKGAIPHARVRMTLGRAAILPGFTPAIPPTAEPRHSGQISGTIRLTVTAMIRLSGTPIFRKSLNR